MKIFSRSDSGNVRSSNQDACKCGIFDDGNAWAVVCDGMGGANGGDYASSTAVEIISDKLVKGYKHGMTGNTVRHLISSAIAAANISIFDRAREDVFLSGMGTTVVVAAVIDDSVIIAHAGDSRAYLLEGAEAAQLTADHSIVQAMVDCGQITEEEAVVHPRKNVITRALGVSEQLDIDFCESGFERNSLILLCTDGLSNYLSIADMKRMAAEYPPEQLADKLVDLANERGGSDNITAAVICPNYEEVI